MSTPRPPPPASVRRLPPPRSPGVSTSSCAASAASARTWRGCSNRRASNTSRPVDETSEHREELKSVVVPPGAWAVGRTLGEVRSRGVEVTFTGVRRLGILGRDPAGDMVLRDGDIVVIYGQPEELERAEAVLLAG